MIYSKKYLAMLLSFLGGLIACQWLPAQEQDLGILGQQAPNWKVSSWHQLPDGKATLDVNDFKGKVTYLYFFQSWCPGCHRHGFPTLKKMTEKYAGDDQVKFVVIQTTFEGHSINTADKLKPTAEKYGLNIPFGQSFGKSGTPEIMTKYRSGGTPWTVVLDRKGIVRFNDFSIPPEKASQMIDRLKLEK